MRFGSARQGSALHGNQVVSRFAEDFLSRGLRPLPTELLWVITCRSRSLLAINPFVHKVSSAYFLTSHHLACLTTHLLVVFVDSFQFSHLIYAACIAGSSWFSKAVLERFVLLCASIPMASLFLVPKHRACIFVQTSIEHVGNFLSTFTNTAHNLV